MKAEGYKKQQHVKKIAKKRTANGNTGIRNKTKNAVSGGIVMGEAYIVSKVSGDDKDEETKPPMQAAVMTSDLVVRTSIKAAKSTHRAAEKAVKTIYRRDDKDLNPKEDIGDKKIPKDRYGYGEWEHAETADPGRKIKADRQKKAKLQESRRQAEKMGITVAVSGEEQRREVWGISSSDSMEVSDRFIMGITVEKKSSDFVTSGKQSDKEKIAGKQKKAVSKNEKNARSRHIRRFMKQYIITSLTEGETKEGTLAKKAVFYQSVLMKKLLVTVVRTMVMAVSAALPILIVPVMAMVLMMLVLSVPPFSWMFPNSMAAEQIVITYEDRMREFGIEIDAYEPDDNTTIYYNVDTNELRKEALLLFMAKKGVYKIEDVTEADCMLYGDILSNLTECTMNINSYVEIGDGSLISGGDGGKYVQNTVRKSDDVYGNLDGVYVSNSCNVHGVTSELTAGGEAIHTVGNWFFIPCEVSQYSSVPIGTCLQISDRNERKPYVLMVVGKYEDTPEENTNLYLCGDMRLYDDDGNAKFYNIETTAYGRLSFYSQNRYYATSIGEYRDNEVEYSGLLDYVHSPDKESRYYNIVYRTPGALAEEFGMTEQEAEDVFGPYYDMENLTEEELEELKEAGIFIPQKDIYVQSLSVREYADWYFSAEEKDNLTELMTYKADNEDIFNTYFEKIFGSIYTGSIMEDILEGVGTEAESTVRYIADIYIKNGIYLPSNASVLAKFVDDNGWQLTGSLNGLKAGDLIFMSSDTGTYKNITDVIMKVPGGYLTCRNGKMTVEQSLPYFNGIVTAQIVMYGRIQ